MSMENLDPDLLDEITSILTATTFSALFCAEPETWPVFHAWLQKNVSDEHRPLVKELTRASLVACAAGGIKLAIAADEQLAEARQAPAPGE